MPDETSTLNKKRTHAGGHGSLFKAAILPPTSCLEQPVAEESFLHPLPYLLVEAAPLKPAESPLLNHHHNQPSESSGTRSKWQIAYVGP